MPVYNFCRDSDSLTDRDDEQGYVVTCSGAYKSGSLRVVRRGVGFTEYATADLEGIQRLWALGNEHGFVQSSVRQRD